MTHKYDILYWGTYKAPHSPDTQKSIRCLGFSIRNEFQHESEFQQEPYLTMAKDRIVKRLKKRGYTDIVITCIEAVTIREKKRRKSNAINKLAKRILGL